MADRPHLSDSSPTGGFFALLETQGLSRAPFDGRSPSRRLPPTGGPSAPPAPLPISARPSLPRLSIGGPWDEGTTETGAADLRVLSVLGEGGMGTVHLAFQRSLQREVALKVPRAARPTSQAALDLIGEAVLMGSLEHPNIVPVHALGTDERGVPVLVMKRIAGLAWYDLLRDASHPYWQRLAMFSDDRVVAHLEILLQVCNAVHFAHGHGVLHRDIKPENVLIGEYGEVYLGDWGIAVRTGTDGSLSTRGAPIAGTPGYLAPEMLGTDDARLDARTDVYLLGATLHSVLTGQPRHSGTTLFDVVSAAQRSEPFAYDAQVPAELAAICNRATLPNPADRPPTVLAFRQSVAEYLRHRGSTALSASAAVRLTEARTLFMVAVLPAEHRRVHTLLTECRFGFAQALREWPENSDARAGLTACLELAFEVEVLHEGEGAAQTLLAEIGEHRADLAERLDALTNRLAERRAAADRLRRLEHDRDFTVGAGSRKVFFAVVLVFGLVLWGVAHFQPGGSQQVSLDDLIFSDGIELAVLTAMILLARRRLLQNAVGFQMVGTFVAITAASLLNRVLGAQFSTPVPAVLVNDMMIIAVSSSVGAMMFRRSMLWWAGFSVLGASASAAWPEAATDIHGGLNVLILGLAMGLRSAGPSLGDGVSTIAAAHEDSSAT